MSSDTALGEHEFCEVKNPTHCSGFSVGGVSVRLFGDCRSDVSLVSSLEPFRVDPSLASLDVRVRWVSDLPPVSGRQVFHSGSTWELAENDDGFQFDFNAAIFGNKPFKRLLIDTAFHSGILQMNEECLLGFPRDVEPLGYPLDELLIMHRLTQEKAIELHGCGIVRSDGEGNLFVGHSGAGKSTTTRLWTSQEDVEILSDDRIIVRREGWHSAADTPCDVSCSRNGKEILRLRDRAAPPHGRFAHDDNRRKMRMYGTPWHGEAMYASPGSALLSRIFVLEHGRGNVLTSLSRSTAVGELFARSFVPFHRHEYVDSALKFLEELVDAVPVYRYEFEPDQRAVDAILNFHD